MASGRSRARRTTLVTPRIARVLPRERLFTLLDRERARRRIVWVEAAPGAGKTALLASWIRARRMRALWYGLDARDDVGSVFLALGSGARARRGADVVPRFQPEHLASLGPYARRFFEALSAPRGAPDVIVLDDYHALGADSLVHSALADGVRGTGSRTTLVVASRGPPPPALAHLRPSGSLGGIPPVSLALTPAEAREVARLHGQELAPGVLALANGWAAGVVLLAAASPRGDADVLVRRSVFEYLAAEAFEATDGRTREVLLRTCLLPVMDGVDAARITGVEGAADVLAALARSGWFVEATGSQPPAFRLHALFREFVARRARDALGAGAFQELVRDSAGVLMQRGDVDAAASLLAAEQAWDELVGVLVERAPALALAGRHEALRRWLDALPDRYADAVPWVRFWRGMSRMLSDPSAAADSVEAALTAFVRGGDAVGAWQAWAASVDLRVQALDDFAPVARAVEALPDLRQRFPFPDPATEAAVMGAAVSGYGNVRPADAELSAVEDRALAIALAPGDARSRMDVARSLALRCAYWGSDLVRARVLLDALRPIAVAPDADPAQTLMWHSGNANYHVHVGEAAAGIAAADRGLALAARTGIHVWDPILLSVRIFGALAAEDLSAAERDVAAAAALPAAGGRAAACSYHYTAATVALRRGDAREAVERGRAAARLAEEVAHPLALAAARIAWAAAAARGGGEGPTLEEAGAFAHAQDYQIAEMGVLLLVAHEALERGAEREAEERLRRALAIARRIGARTSVFVSRAEMAELCAFALERDVDPELAFDVARVRGLAPGPRARCATRWPWPVRVEALGGLAVHRDGAALPGGKAQRKPLELLRLLVASGERGMTLERLAAELWPDADGDTAHHALETTLYRLRRLLADPDAVVRRAGRAALDPARVFVDAWAFESLASRAEAERARGNAAEALRAAAAAVELYRGDLFPDEVQPAFERARARLRARVERISELPRG